MVAPRSPAKMSVAQPGFSRVDADPKRQSSVAEFAAGGGLLGKKALEKAQQNRQRQEAVRSSSQGRRDRPS